MNIKPIRNEVDYKNALKTIEPFFENEPEKGTPQADYFDIMLELISRYEEINYPVDFPDPVEAIKFSMETQGLTVKDFKDSIGQPNRVYEVLNRKRNLTLPMIRRLNKNLNIPLESLIKETKMNTKTCTDRPIK